MIDPCHCISPPVADRRYLSDATLVSDWRLGVSFANSGARDRSLTGAAWLCLNVCQMVPVSDWRLRNATNHETIA